MSDDVCVHELTLNTCSLCKPKGKTRAMRDFRAARRMANANQFQAQYDGTCMACGGDIEMGDYIFSNNDGGYDHTRCAP